MMQPSNTAADVMSFEVNLEYHSVQRFPAWITLTVSSTVTLVAVATTIKNRDFYQNVAFGVTIMSLFLSFISTMAYLTQRSTFVSARPEKFVIFLTALLWVLSMPLIMSPHLDIAIEDIAGQGPVIRNANLFFFSWISLGAIIYILASFMQEVWGFKFRGLAPQMYRWLGLAASSLVTLAAGAQVLNDTEDCSWTHFNKRQFCRRTSVAIGIGSVSTIVSLALVCIYCRTSREQPGPRPMRELVVTTIMFVIWTFGVSYITFGRTPGATISNLYFAAWISFLLTLTLFTYLFRALTLPEAETQREQQTLWEKRKPVTAPLGFSASNDDVSIGEC